MMNRRQFTASLGALSGAAAIPLPSLAAAASAPSAIATDTYAWAKLIVRAQAKADPAMLARHLKLAPDAAQNLFQTLVRDGVLRTPAATGLAQAAQPLQSGSHTIPSQSGTHHRLKASLESLNQDAEALVNEDHPALGCASTVEEECPDARTYKSVQEGPQTR